jgi:hypothetical protein
MFENRIRKKVAIVYEYLQNSTILINENYIFENTPLSNQITVVAFQSVQLAQASFLQKNQTLQNVFTDVMLRWYRA